MKIETTVTMLGDEDNDDCTACDLGTREFFPVVIANVPYEAELCDHCGEPYSLVRSADTTAVIDALEGSLRKSLKTLKEKGLRIDMSKWYEKRDELKGTLTGRMSCHQPNESAVPQTSLWKPYDTINLDHEEYTANQPQRTAESLGITALTKPEQTDLFRADTLWRPIGVLPKPRIGNLIAHKYNTDFQNYRDGKSVLSAVYKFNGYRYNVILYFDQYTGRRIA